MDLARDVIFALDLIENNIELDNFSKMYLVGTENLKNIFDGLSISGKALVVSGSGDCLINSIVSGAKDIVAFDKNFFAKYLVDFKLASVKGLKKEEYVNMLFNDEKRNVLSKIYFDKIKQYLNSDSYLFWRILFAKGIDISKIFINHNWHYGECVEFKRKEFIENNIYMEDENYENLKRQIEDINITYVDEDLFSLEQEENINKNTYDFIYLSNIHFYVNVNEYKKIINEFMVKHLNKDSLMIYGYLYNLFLNDYDECEMIDVNAPNIFRKNNEFVSAKIIAGKKIGVPSTKYYHDEEGYFKNDIDDAVFTYKK